MDRTEIKDRIVCSDCGEEFGFTFGEAEFYQSKGLTTPRRCKPCRQELRRKKRRDDEQREVRQND